MTRATAKKRILLVGSGSKHYLMPLRRSGYLVEGPRAPEEARFMCSKTAFNLIMLDVCAEPRTAFRLCHYIRRTSPRAFVVFLLDSKSRLPSITCPPDDVVHRAEGLEQMLERVDGLLAA